jgi:hypothetical protein
MQESKDELKEESNDLKEKGKKRKIVIKSKAGGDIICDADDNLVETNCEYLKEIFTETHLEELKKRYAIDKESREKNVYNFIDAYRHTIKRQFNEETQPSINNELFNRIASNPEKVKVVWSGCLQALRRLPSESVGHIVTSPPYYNAREYSTWPNLQAYLDDMRQIILECYRVLDNHRVFVFNVSDVVDNDKMDKINAFGFRKIPLPAYFITMFEECGFTYVDDIIWDKGEVQSSRHKNGNKPFPFFQYACNCYEHILIFHKHRLEKDVRYPCNDCGSLNVKSNSYTFRGLRSWE